MSFLRSLRARLTGWYSGVLALVLVGFGMLLYSVVRYQYLHHHDDGLQQGARAALAILALRPDCASLVPEQRLRLERLNRQMVIREEGGSGNEVYRSPALSATLLPRDWVERTASGTPFATLEGPMGLLRVYSAAHSSPAGRRCSLHVMDSLGHVNEALRTLRWSLILMVPLSLLVASGGGYWLASRALRPVDEITRRARRIGATNLAARLPSPNTDDELARLTQTLNEMIERLEQSFASMQRFTADASHELKTPLTILRTAIDVALGRGRSAEEYRLVLAGMLESVEQMTRIVGDLLFLARADSGHLALREEPLRLDELAMEVTAAMAPLAASKSVRLDVHSSGPLPMTGDERWLRHMLYNLVDNAIKYTPSGGGVEVALLERGGETILSVADTGPGIPPEERGRLFERFYRLDRARSRGDGGAGLGLAIALWIAHSHGGAIEVDSELGRGSAFRVRLPRLRQGGPPEA